MKLKIGLCLALLALSSSRTWGYPVDELKKEADKMMGLYQSALREQLETETNQLVVRNQGNRADSDVKLHPYKDYSAEERKAAELVHIRELIRIMGADNPPAGPDPDAACLNGGTSTTMNYEDLQLMINSMHIVFGTQFTDMYYLARDFGLHKTEDVNQRNGILDFLSPYVTNNNLQSLPTSLWMNKAPCPTCAHTLLREYNKTTIKPTIFIGSLYNGMTWQETAESLRCLVKMMNEGYTISAWDWRSFRDNIHHSDCRDAINTALAVPAFEDSKTALEQLLQFLGLSALSTTVQDWCPYAA